jgi:dihydroflavonol-4-reductase
LIVDNPIVTPYSLAAVRSNSQISHEKAVRELGFHPRPARQAILDTVRWWQERSGEPGVLPETIARATS